MEFIKAKTILSGYKLNNPWFGTNYTVNLYRGCHHGCIYCDSRSECYQVENFDEVRAKAQAIEILTKELSSKRNKGVIGMGAMSDPYNSFEMKYELTRQALFKIHDYKYGVALDTKSPLVTRDIDILKEIQKHAPVLVKMTITTFNDKGSALIEPHVAVSSKRFEAVKELSDAGIYTGVLMMPILPFINDSEANIKNIVRHSAEAGARFVFTYGFSVTLRDTQRSYYYEQLQKLFPTHHLVEKYTKMYGNQYIASSNQSERLWQVFKEECEKCGLLYEMDDIIDDYKNKYYGNQISLF